MSSASSPSSTPSSEPECTAGTAAASTAAAAIAAERKHRAVAGACRDRLAERRPPHLPLGDREPPETVVGGVVGDELRQRIEQVDHAGREHGALDRAPARGRPRETDHGERHHDRADGERSGEREPRRRCESDRDGDRPEADDERRERRCDHAHEQMLQRVDVRDEAAEQVARSRAPDLVRHERLEAP